MKSKRFAYIPLLFIVLAIFLAQYSDLFSNRVRYANHFETILNQKSEKIEKYFNKLENISEKQSVELIDKIDKDDIIILKYVNDSLVFWSSNSVSLFEFYPDRVFAPRVVRFFNSFYYVKKRIEPSVKYVGLIQINSRFPYQNAFLHSGFNEDFGLPKNTHIRFQTGEGTEIHDKDGQYLFNVVIPYDVAIKNPRLAIATFILFFGIILFGVFIINSINKITDSRKKFSSFFMASGVIVLLRVLQMLFLDNYFNFLLFDPFVFADSAIVPSLGDLFVNSLIVMFLAIGFYKFIDYTTFTGKGLWRKYLSEILANLLLVSFFIYAHYFFYSLIFNSNISFRPNEFDQLSSYTLLIFLANGMNFLAFGIILLWNIRMYDQSRKLSDIIKVSFPVYAVSFFFLIYLGYPLDFLSVLFFIVFYFLFLLLYFRRFAILSYSFLEVFIVIFSLYSIGYILTHANEKERTIRSVLAVSLANEHDPVAEYLFEDLSQQIRNDTAIQSKLNNQVIDIDNFYDYLKRTYFRGYWNKYDIKITLCGPSDSVLIGMPDYQWFYCYGFFYNIIKEAGFALPGSNFYYLDKHTGRISYLGLFSFMPKDGSAEITLYIEMDSRLTRDLLGYPELLLDEKLHQKRLIDQYSYAKYHKGQLVAQFGNFSYSLNSTLFGKGKEQIEIFPLDNYEHLLYRSDKENLIVLSKPTVKFIDLLVTFSYLFLFYYLCLIIIVLVRAFSDSDFKLLNNFRNKIQFSIISVLLVSLILIASSTVWLNFRIYKQNQNKILNEKIQSVLLELDRRLSMENSLTAYWHSANYDNLSQLLIRFSDIFFTDINLYDPNGNLIATSRVEIFQMGLKGGKMDPVAYYKMHNERRAQYIHGEKISDLSYNSAYVPFENAEGKLLAYLNLPYFTKQKELQTAITALIVTIINIYVILILLIISVTIIISDQITRPLELLQLHFRALKLGGRYEKIDYKKDDEIGNLVKEYNKMVKELQRSVELIARSERESAWREMARQIAHEIKNPLTPMRLSVQQLQKSWRNKDENYEKYLDRVTNTLIEQIDNLSSIASEFSNFAQMPVAHIEKIDIVKILNKTVELFDGNPNYTISFEPKVGSAFINADREQMSRVFINVVKNAIQSFPDQAEGRIVIKLDVEEARVIVRITDNGKGIPEDIKSKLFIPNFTTKSGGMGLGLAIVRNIITQIGGDISFETEIGAGTTFIVRLPLVF
jgi:two-component system nitrogen regulation sensor histidine kinase NtrY